MGPDNEETGMCENEDLYESSEDVVEDKERPGVNNSGYENV